MARLVCVLCGSDQILPLETRYHHCHRCDLRFLDPAYRLSADEEKKRYLTHNNDVNDLRYQQFVTPLFSEITKRAKASSHGLDFGSGTGPVLTKMLKESGYSIQLYDPYFANDERVFDVTYDFIFSCEVVEHFYEPHFEFTRLKTLLKPNGFLAIMTHLYDDSIDFNSWYYRQDPTHVVFYSQKTFGWIAQSLDYREPVFSGNRLIVI
jgi:hypothetical protein